MGSKDKKGKYQDYKVIRNQDNQLKCNCLAFQCGRTKVCKHILNIKDKVPKIISLDFYVVIISDGINSDDLPVQSPGGKSSV